MIHLERYDFIIFYIHPRIPPPWSTQRYPIKRKLGLAAPWSREYPPLEDPSISLPLLFSVLLKRSTKCILLNLTLPFRQLLYHLHPFQWGTTHKILFDYLWCTSFRLFPPPRLCLYSMHILKFSQFTLQELKLQGIKIRDGVVFSRYSRAQCFAIKLSDFD